MGYFKSKSFISATVVGVILGFLISPRVSHRLSYQSEGGEQVLYSTPHILVPWFAQGVSSSTIPLNIFLPESNRTSAEQNKLGSVLLGTQMFPSSEYVLQQDSVGDWFLCQSERTYRYFTWNFPVQIWYGSPVEK